MQTGNWEGGNLEQLSQQIESMPHHNLNGQQTQQVNPRAVTGFSVATTTPSE
jgi:hypothetical protein